MSDNPIDLLDELLRTVPNEDTDLFNEENQRLAPLLPEINRIMDQGIRFFTRAMLLAAGAEFWEAPASTSGKHHPPDEHSTGGNVLHTLRVCRLVRIMCDSQDRDQMERDVAMAAALLHDLCKNVVWADGSYHYDVMHPYMVDRMFMRVRAEEDPDTATQQSTTLLCEESFTFEILRAIRCHLGPWSPIPETFPAAALEWVLHFADNIASKLHEVVDDAENVVVERWEK